MNALAETASDQRTEVMRWATCFAVVAAAHGLGAMALLNHTSETSDFGVTVPVVLLDLPESLATSTAPAMDLPPGPVEEETEATPPPMEETKPPEPEAEVAIPIPEPPKPEPPKEEKHATAPPQANAPRVSVVRWQSRLMSHLERFKRYPDKARGRLGTANPRSKVGSAMVSFTIDREGHLLSSSIIQSSGSAPLDDEALSVVARAQPLPRPPDHISDAELTVILPMNFIPPR